MPHAPLRPCAFPRCPALVPVGARFCTRHDNQQRAQTDRERGASNTRGYDQRWRNLRAWYLARHPLCECDECARAGDLGAEPSEVVDHRLPIATHPHLRLDPDNLRAMSQVHHNAHTARTRGWGRGRP